MKNTFCFLPLLLIFNFCLFADNKEDSSVERLKNNPAIYLNSQDVPFFYTGNPLEGLCTFTVIPPYSIQSPEINDQIGSAIETELGYIGTVVKIQDENLEESGSSNILNLQIGRISKWDGGDLPISRVTLSIETPVILSKTNVKSLPRIWTINNFVDSPFDNKSEEKIIGAFKKLLKEFTQNYRFANSEKTQKPIFYVY